MCGIIGMVSNFPIADDSWLLAGRDLMIHRGPDGAGVWKSKDNCAWMGHRRLSIIDLSSSGSQPMLDATNQVCIVFNGEIYNYKDLKKKLQSLGYIFYSSSDTEVVLAAYVEWGGESLQRLNGMFALGIHDQKKQCLFLARDRAGEKPLFYHHSHKTMLFASELKALITSPHISRRLDLNALDCYLAYGYVPGDRCILRGVKKLPPAHALLFNMESGKVRVWRYWNLPEYDNYAAEDRVDEEVLLDELDVYLEDAVRHQLVADVPVGVLLSGGVDSSLITAMAVRSEANIRTFTIRFPGYGSYDETKHARLIANYFGTEHIELEANEVSVDLLPILAQQFDEPMIDSSMIPTYLVSKLVRQYCKVALGGDGGDELFGGYWHYSRLLWMQRWLAWLPYKIRYAAAMISSAILPVGFKGRNWIQGFTVDLQLLASYFDYYSRQRLINLKELRTPIAEEIREARTPQNGDLLFRSTRMDFENYLPEDILVKVDRTSMLNSLEVRAPFLDYRIIEFAFGKVPSFLKATSKYKKILLKKFAARLLPKEFDFQRKQGFSIPLSAWLNNGPWKEFFHDTLLSSNASFFNRQYVMSLLDGQACGRANNERLFGLLMFELWRKEYRINL